MSVITKDIQNVELSFDDLDGGKLDSIFSKVIDAYVFLYKEEESEHRYGAYTIINGRHTLIDEEIDYNKSSKILYHKAKYELNPKLKRAIIRCDKHYRKSLNLNPIGLSDYNVSREGKVFEVDNPDTKLEHVNFIYNINGIIVNGPLEYVRNRFFNNMPMTDIDIIFKPKLITMFKNNETRGLEETDYYLRPKTIDKFIVEHIENENKTFLVSDIGGFFNMRYQLMKENIRNEINLYCQNMNEFLSPTPDVNDYLMRISDGYDFLTINMKLSEIKRVFKIGHLLKQKI